MKYVAPIARASGRSLEEMASATAMLGNAGIQGSEAGTALRAIMIRLAKPTAEANKVLKEQLEIETEREGRVLSLSEGSGTVRREDRGFNGGPESGCCINGSPAQRPLVHFLALMDTGQPALEGFTDRLEESGGIAKTIADKQLDNLNGAMEKVNSAMEGARLSIGETFIPILTSVAVFVNKIS
ncbi:phage tail tape measure protein [Paenibacillus melissococcoides]|uniref:phage tail tape measure protein n=1 Tax=Paenibacillus melissococcoides TaxID=2912268 RepID=UPI0021C32EC0|nr:phage tail tape measure protein [Paenibacillus melissococcoides]